MQTFHVLDELRLAFPNAAIDWVTEETFVPLVSAHPYVRKVFALNLKELKKKWRERKAWKKLFSSIEELRSFSYDVLFDLQGNCKSGLVTFFSKAKIKVGLDYKSVREKPNVLFTNLRFEISKETNIRDQYVAVVRKFLNSQKIHSLEITSKKGVKLQIREEEKRIIDQIFSHPSLQNPIKIMVCPGSQWVNKQIPITLLSQFLSCIKEKIPASFVLIWGSEAEKRDCEQLQSEFPSCSLVIEKLPITVWQNLMHEVDAVIAVDSSALHLCGTTQTPSFSVFGPTSPSIFKPIGSHHVAFQGVCPYEVKFLKTCPRLRSCSTGACMKNLQPKKMALAFFSWWDHHFLE